MLVVVAILKKIHLHVTWDVILVSKFSNKFKRLNKENEHNNLKRNKFEYR
ncbi:hypothetical protein T190611E02C_50107 [Tenacibaculum sp. 190524A05c]